MKMKTLLALALTLSTISVFAADIKIPKEILDRHAALCPDFISEDRGSWMTRESFQMPGTEYSPVGPTMYLLGCEMYAYNSMEKAYLINAYRDVTTVAIAEVGTDGGITATSSLMGAGFDLETLTLGTFQKGRGMGDCGSAATYKYDAGNEKFVLIEARLKDTCDGEETEWPIIYKK